MKDNGRKSGMIKNKRIIKLGIAIDYPINWSYEMVLRDLVQNFYDSIKEDSFGEKFRIVSMEKTRAIIITMETQGEGFSSEWLNYIGGSTKTDQPGKYIGMYGEGFKMCMLNLVKQGITDCSMESRNWSLKPCIYKESVSDRKVDMLGYQYSERKDDGYTRFTMVVKNLYYYNPVATKEVLLNFFYKENKLFAQKIVETDKCTIYKRNSILCPSSESDENFKGILFVNGLARARIDIPFAINLKLNRIKFEKRNRRTLYPFEANRMITEASEYLDSESSYKFLIEMYDRWFDLPVSWDDVDTWYYCICNLVRNVVKEKEYAERFMHQYNQLYYIGRFGSDRAMNKRMREARAYASKNGYRKWCNLNPIFRLLGANSLMEMYEKEKLSLYRICNDREEGRLTILFETTELLFKKDTFYDDRPEVLIIDNDEKGNKICEAHPLQFAERDYSSHNMRKYRINKVVFSSEEIMDEDFIRVVLCFISKLIYAYCTEKSNKRACFLTELGEKIIECREMVCEMKLRWSHA